MPSIRYCNSIASVQNIVIEDGQMIVTLYHKSMGLIDEMKIYIRVDLSC